VAPCSRASPRGASEGRHQPTRRRLLSEVGTSNQELSDLVHDELRRIARVLVARLPARGTLSPTDVVHEAWLRLEVRGVKEIRDRQHFLALAARCMRQVLVDHSRERSAAKRGGDLQRVTLNEALVGQGDQHQVDTLDLDRALTRLGDMHERPARVVELRFFGGMTESEIAEVLGVSRRTVTGDLQIARAWLTRELDLAGQDPD